MPLVGLTNLDKQTETQASVQNHKHALQLKTSSTTSIHEGQQNTRQEWKKMVYHCWLSISEQMM
jgi:hypothetical protein